MLIIKFSHYGSATADGMPADQNKRLKSRNKSHTQKIESFKPSKNEHQSSKNGRKLSKNERHPKGNKSRSRTPERRNNGQDGSEDRRQYREDGFLDSRNEDTVKRNYSLPRSDRGLSGD
jgi:hypothetical protein